MTSDIRVREFASVFAYYLFIRRQKIEARRFLRALLVDTRKELGLEDQ